jgi:hypothetical protein
VNHPSALQTLRAFAERRSRRFALVVCIPFALPPLLALVAFGGRGDPKSNLVGAFLASMFVGIGVGIAWLYYPNNAIRLMREARQLAMPSMVRPALSALALLFAVTVLAPAAILAGFGGGHFPFFLGALASMAFAGMLLPLLNFRIAIAMVVLGYGGKFALSFFAPIEVPSLSFDQSVSGWLSLGAATILGSLCAYRWVRVQRDDTVSSFVGTGSAVAAAPGRRGPPLGDAGPRDRAYAIGAWLDPPQPAQAWRRFAGYFAALGLNAAFVGYLASRIATGVLLPGIGLLFGVIVLSASGPRLRRLFLPGNGTLADLALIPGWGDVAHARRGLLVAALQPLLEILLVATACVMLAAIVAGVGVVVWPVIAGMAIVLGSTSLASSLTVLADMESARDRLIPVAGGAFVVLAGIAAYWANTRGPFGMDTALSLGLACLAWSAGMGWIALGAYRRIAARPHPFLTR